MTNAMIAPSWAKLSERYEADPERADVWGARESWGDGPWQSEPDRVLWEAHGLACLIVRNHHGVLCGYVGVEPCHPLHGKDYNDAPDLEVHGGLTYSNECAGRICHVPEPGKPEHLWWLGFDCLHSGDLSPGMAAYLRTRMPDYGEHDSYRNLDYVRHQVEQLAAQLKALA